jgi:hypothetical protein
MKQRTFVISLSLILAIAGLCLLNVSAKSNDNDSESRIKTGFAIAPVHLDLHKKNRAKVGLGSYLLNALGGCNDCHTCPSYKDGGKPYLGQDPVVNDTNYLAGGVNFGPGPNGDIISKNLTPDAKGLPAGLTLAEFISTIRTGHDPEGDLLLVMPWPIFRNQTDHDLEAIYTYLSSIPQATPGTCSFAGE